MGQRLRCSSRAVPYSGGGVTPVTLTPNFEFPITAAQLGNKTITASSPVTMDDLVSGFVLIDSNGVKWLPVLRDDVYYLENANERRLNTVSLSSDGLTITFGSSTDTDTLASFTFNA